MWRQKFVWTSARSGTGDPKIKQESILHKRRVLLSSFPSETAVRQHARQTNYCIYRSRRVWYVQ